MEDEDEEEASTIVSGDIMAHGISQEKMDEIGLDSEQVNVLKKCFDGFCQDGSIRVDTIGSILTMMV